MKNSWIHAKSGETPRQARVDVHDMNEEHLSRQGFAGPVSMIYRKNRPVDPVRVEGAIAIRAAALDLLSTGDSDADGLPTKVFYNENVEVFLSRRSDPMPYLFRNIDADSLLFVHEGKGTFATEFGPIPYEPNDFVLIPKGISYRQLPDSQTVAMVVESRQPIGFTEHAQVGRHAPFDSSVVYIPEVDDYDWPHQEEWELRLKHGDETTSCFYEALPFDLVGWKGDLFPCKLNVRDIRAITSERAHLAPSSWSVFEAETFMCVVFQSMKAVTDPDAEELPSRHRNIDSEELVLMKTGPDGKPANVLLHMPQGLTHGPNGVMREMFQAYRKAMAEKGEQIMRMLEGVSIDSYHRLHPTEAYLQAIEAMSSKKTKGAGK